MYHNITVPLPNRPQVKFSVLISAQKDFNADKIDEVEIERVESSLVEK